MPAYSHNTLLRIVKTDLRQLCANCGQRRGAHEGNKEYCPASISTGNYIPGAFRTDANFKEE